MFLTWTIFACQKLSWWYWKLRTRSHCASYLTCLQWCACKVFYTGLTCKPTMPFTLSFLLLDILLNTFEVSQNSQPKPRVKRKAKKGAKKTKWQATFKGRLNHCRSTRTDNHTRRYLKGEGVMKSTCKRIYYVYTPVWHKWVYPIILEYWVAQITKKRKKMRNTGKQFNNIRPKYQTCFSLKKKQDKRRNITENCNTN